MIFKFSTNHLFLIGAFILVFIIFTHRFYIREGQTSDSTADETCDPSVNLKENPNDAEIGKLISDHVANSASIIDSYLPQLQEIKDKFRNISSCLSIGSVDISSENSFPVITIENPEDGTINQQINYILPKGQKGEPGRTGVFKGATGLWGKKGKNGDRGPVGENVIPNNIYDKIY
jgi:hypothetical protein